LFASAIGLMYHNNRADLMKRIMIPIGLFFLAYGLIGCLNFEKTISTPDLFWYFKTHLELGIFMLVLLVMLGMEKGKDTKPSFVGWFSRVSLTIYLFETPLSEIVRLAALRIVPGWNMTINGCLLFGSVNVIIWIIILSYWRKWDFRYSLEYFWVRSFAGKRSSKLDSL
jgi:hypothetical protein